MKHYECPSCGSEDIHDFFRVPDAPIQSLINLGDRAEALAIPRTDIDLCLCRGCGFVFNSAYDTSYDYYTKGYEDQQGFSPTFRRFITGVTQRFIDRYDVREKDVVEIGCGKGDFIALMCELGENRGVGIDPAWVPGRVEPGAHLRFIPEFYSTEHRALAADCICCRHTMEHVFATRELLRTIRQSLEGRPDTVVFMEVPSIVRILRQQTFWDIFNEHCSYFSPGSLARLFRANGFEVLDLYLEYQDQYLFIEARAVDTPSTRIHPLEESVADMERWAAEFAAGMTSTLAEWRRKLTALKARGAKTVIWGGGSKSVGFLTHFDHLGAIEHVVDINPHMAGNYIPGIGKRYMRPDFLREYRPDAVILMNSVYTAEIKQALNDMGLDPELHPL